MDWKPLRTNCEDLIHDIAYDFYGQRLATCSSDRTLKIFDYSTESHEWIESDSFKCADSTVLKCIWAHPEYGQIIACCSTDKSVRIFEEQEHEARNSGKRWIERRKLEDARASVHDIWFAPSHLGLRLASIAADGIVRIYEAMEPNNLAKPWTLLSEFSVISSPLPRDIESSFCLTWCPSRFATPTLAVGAMDMMRLYTMDDAGKWKPSVEITHGGLIRDITWGANMGRSYHLLATACKDGHVRILKLKETEGQSWESEIIGDFPDHNAQVWRVSFNVTGTILSSAGDDAKIRLWKGGYANQFQCISVISMIPQDES